MKIHLQEEEEAAAAAAQNSLHLLKGDGLIGQLGAAHQSGLQNDQQPTDGSPSISHQRHQRQHRRSRQHLARRMASRQPEAASKPPIDEESAESLRPRQQPLLQQQHRQVIGLGGEVQGLTGSELEGKEPNNDNNNNEEEEMKRKQLELDDGSEPTAFKPEPVWANIGLFVVLHSCLPVGVWLLISERPWPTLAWTVLGIYLSGLGVTAGTHRLWSHRSYKARWPLQVLLMCLQTMAGQNSILTWSRDHRVHHKFSETDADPHNIKRGFFFAHMGWLCYRKHPDVKSKGRQVELDDLERNWVVRFQHAHFWWLSLVFNVALPTLIPVYLWNERPWTSFVFGFMVRYLVTLHGTWLVNSAAHYFGERPYDERIEARESPMVIYNALGEGFHNYHHTFPFDYATSEFGRYLNLTTAFIDACAWLGLAYDLRKVDQASVLRRRLRTGGAP